MPQTVRAKFVCNSITKELSGKAENPFRYSYRFSAVYANGNEENRTFWEQTPAGSIELVGMKDDLFEVGKSYYIDFTLAPA